MTQLEIARRQGYLNDLSDAEALSGEIRRMLNSLIAKLTRPVSAKTSI